MSRFVLIGHPVSHSLSPAIHRAAYAWLGESHEYQLVDAADEAQVKRQVQALREGEIAGANVTVPHKRLALRLADRLDASAERIGAANVLARDAAGRIVAYNTDAPGLAEVLGRLAPGARRAVVLGSGGAALACVVACEQLGALEVLVSARRFQEGVEPAQWPHAAEFLRLGAQLLPWPLTSEHSRQELATCQLLLQATSAGMQGAEPGHELADALPWSRLADTAAAYDLVYNPAETPFLKRARARGLVAEGGLSMLVAQARHALGIWLGRLPPEAPLLEAAKRSLEARG